MAGQRLITLVDQPLATFEQMRRHRGRIVPPHLTRHTTVERECLDQAGLHHDFGVWLEKLAPFNPDPNVYHHNRTGEDNADAHLKRTIMGREVVVAITNGKLDLGPWEAIFYGEFDGQRDKRVLIKIIGE
jgi:secondary thiamine-phosphate synthase enzyme